MSASDHFDVVVVGAGPAGSAAAMVAARAGLSVCLLERGPFAGSKNMYGGVVYGRILDQLVPRWWEEAPIQRWITRRGTMLATPTQSMTIDVRATAWGEAPYNGATALRPEFDSWLADRAVADGATLVCSTTATGLLRSGGRVTGVITDRPDDTTDSGFSELRADVVIACDGVNSFLAKEAGLHHHQGAEHYTLGVKEVLHLGKDEIDRRFNVTGREGADFEIVGCTNGVPGGGFVYTNLETVAIGCVLSLEGLAAHDQRPEEIIADMKRHPALAPLVDGGDLKEFSAHLIPEAGYDAMPELACDGMLIAGDAAGMCLAAGIWLEGVNFAIGSGMAAGETAVAAVRQGRPTVEGPLGGYRRRLESSFVLQDHKRLRRVPQLLMSERTQRIYPEIACNVVEELFTVRNPSAKPGLGRIAVGEVKRAGVRARDLARDGWTALRSYG